MRTVIDHRRENQDSRHLLAALLKETSDHEFLEIRSIAPNGHVSQLLYEVQVLRRRAFAMPDLNQFDGSANVYYGVVPRVERRGTADACGFATAIWADFDNGPPPVLRLPPSLVIETSPGRYQALWLLDSPTPDLQRIEAVNRSVAALNDGDMNTCDRARVLRLPGFRNLKYPSRPPSRLVVSRVDRRFRLGELEEAFPAQSPAKSVRQPSSVHNRAPSWLEVVYEALADYLAANGFLPRDQGTGGIQARCPMHDDRSPSLSLHPVRGWKCFAGCGQGRLTVLASRLGISIGGLS